MFATPACLRNQRGVALVMALLLLLIMSLLSATLLLSVNTETKISGHSLRETQALNAAEAGVSEAIARIRSREVPDDPNPRMVAQIFLANPGSVPVLGPDSTALPTAQPSGDWLNYSAATKGPGVLTVKYKTDPAQTLIYKYDRDLNPAVQTMSGLPIYVIESTGRRGSDRRTVVAEVTPKPVSINIQAGLNADVNIKFSGTSAVCGYNHRADTPPGIGVTGRIGLDGCNLLPGTFWELGAGHVAGARSTGAITESGATDVNGSPDTMSHQIGFYAGPWEALGMSQAEFYSWVGPPQSAEPLLLNGILHLDNNSIAQDAAGDFKFNAGVGEGFMYVDGDLTVNGGFIYHGLIYVEGNLKINGVAWVLGAIVVNGTTEVKLAVGSCTVLFSHDAITQNLARYGGQFTTLSWRETP